MNAVQHCLLLLNLYIDIYIRWDRVMISSILATFDGHLLLHFRILYIQSRKAYEMISFVGNLSLITNTNYST